MTIDDHRQVRHPLRWRSLIILTAGVAVTVVGAGCLAARSPAWAAAIGASTAVMAALSPVAAAMWRRR